MRVRCAVTPSTSRTLYSPTGGPPPATRSARVARTSRSRCSASKRTSSARLRALPRADTDSVHAPEVLPGAGVDFDLLAGDDEQRDVDGRARLQLRRLGAA